jgi:hypothetical protein
VHIVNRTGRREHEVALLLVGLLAGSGGLFSRGAVAPPVLESFGTLWIIVFFTATFVSSCIALSGIFLPWRGVKGLLIEAGGLWLQAAGWVGYGLAVYAKLGSDGFLFALTVCGFSIAHIIRAIRIPKEAKAVAVVAVATGIVDTQEES